VSDGISAALATNLSSLGLANLQIEALVNGNRLKIGVFGDNSVAGQDYSFRPAAPSPSTCSRPSPAT